MVKSILILEADAPQAGDLVAALREVFPNARFRRATNLAAFYAALAAETPDLAAVRLTLDGVNEFEAIERCRAESAEMRLILNAISAPEPIRHRAVELECAIITVPATAEKVLAALDCCAAERAKSARNAAAYAYS